MALPQANVNACIVTGIVCFLLILNNEVLKVCNYILSELYKSIFISHLQPWLAKKTRIPIPIELIAVVFGTTASTLMDMSANYNITTVGHIPKG